MRGRGRAGEGGVSAEEIQSQSGVSGNATHWGDVCARWEPERVAEVLVRERLELRCPAHMLPDELPYGRVVALELLRGLRGQTRSD